MEFVRSFWRIRSWVQALLKAFESQCLRYSLPNPTNKAKISVYVESIELVEFLLILIFGLSPERCIRLNPREL